MSWKCNWFGHKTTMKVISSGLCTEGDTGRHIKAYLKKGTCERCGDVKYAAETANGQKLRDSSEVLEYKVKAGIL